MPCSNRIFKFQWVPPQLLWAAAGTYLPVSHNIYDLRVAMSRIFLWILKKFHKLYVLSRTLVLIIWHQVIKKKNQNKPKYVKSQGFIYKQVEFYVESRKNNSHDKVTRPHAEWLNVPQVSQQHFRRKATKRSSDCCLGAITELNITKLKITIRKQECRSKIFRKLLYYLL